jgi:hypothetical protein
MLQINLDCKGATHMRGRIVELAVISLFLVACSATPAANVPDVTPTTDIVATQATTDASVATEVATAMPEAATATPMVASLSTPVSLDAPEATALAAITTAELPVVTPDNSLMASPLGDVAMVALGGDAAGQFFATTVKGFLTNFDQPHPVTIYQKQGTKFVSITHYDLTNGENIDGIELLPNPDKSHMLFYVHGIIGAHSGFGTVLSFDGKTIKSELATQSDASGASLTAVDINGDGVLDVTGDTTDYLVFDYNSGVQITSDTVSSWDGTKFVEQKLTTSSDATIQKAIDYANAQRWNMVTSLLPTIAAPTTDSDKWNVGLLTHWSTLRMPEKDASFPLMSAIFYGDYDVAVKMLQALGAKEVAKPTGKWFAASFVQADMPITVDDSKIVFDNVVKFSTLALTQDDTITSARFLRGWAKTMANPKDAEGLKDLEAVASADPFYAAVRDAIVSR